MKTKTELKVAAAFAALTMLGLIIIIFIPYMSGFAETYEKWKEAGFPNVEEVLPQFEIIIEKVLAFIITLLVLLSLTVFILIRNLKHFNKTKPNQTVRDNG